MLLAVRWFGCLCWFRVLVCSSVLLVGFCLVLAFCFGGFGGRLDLFVVVDLVLLCALLLGVIVLLVS